MTFEHPSGLQNAHDRQRGKPDHQSLVFGEGYLQGTDLNGLQTIARERHGRLGALVARDGDIVEGAAAMVTVASQEVLLTPGKIWLSGDVFAVNAKTIYAVPMTGRVEVGVRKVTTYVTALDDPNLNGLVPGVPSEDEPGAAIEKVSISWALSSDAGEGQFVPVYVLQDGVIIDQTPPPSLSGISAAIAADSRRADGNFISEGCQVTALGKTGADQVFSIKEGVAVIFGFPRTRLAALRHVEPEEFDTKNVPAESHTFAGASANVIEVSNSPIATVGVALVTKQKTVTLTRGGTTHGADALPDNSIVTIVSVSQGATSFVSPADYLKTGDNVDWSPAGAEPATGSSYDVTYQYRASVSVDASTDTTVTVSGGLDGGEVLLSYTYKLPRIDRLCLDRAGNTVYIKGVSAERIIACLPPLVPSDVLPLAQIVNSWSGQPDVINDGVYAWKMEDIQSVAQQVQDLQRLMMLERRESEIDRREPALKRGMFVDPFTDDSLRDHGEVQTATVANGVMQLAVTPTFHLVNLDAPVSLDFVEEIIIRQEQETICEKINEYLNFEPLPGALSLTPAADFWVENLTQWTSGVTTEFQRGVRFDGGPLVTSSAVDEVVAQRQEQAEFLRSINVAFAISGFGAGEILETLTFDGIDVKPAGVVTANANGEISDTFTIPSGITAGSKRVIASGQGGTDANAIFTGAGTINIDVMRRVTTVSRWQNGAWQETRNLGSDSDRSDPQAQTFMLTESRQIVGVDFKLCAVGAETNGILVEQTGTDNGYPAPVVNAEAFLPMVGAVVGWQSARYGALTHVPANSDNAIVIKTDDAIHAIGMARLGDFDADTQSFVSQQPYVVGDNFSGATGRAWVAHPERDLTFRLIAAKFTQIEKTVALGSFDISQASDLLVRAAVELPSGDCSVVFRVTRGNGETIFLRPNQPLSLSEYLTETVQLHAILRGTEKLSPVLYPPVQFITGTLAAEGTYITRAFKFGSSLKLTAIYKAMLPTGATFEIEYDKADDAFVALPQVGGEALADPDWVERDHAASGVTAVNARIKITITGAPDARPLVGDFGAKVT